MSRIKEKVGKHLVPGKVAGGRKYATDFARLASILWLRKHGEGIQGAALSEQAS